jgi:hypothetical protein
MKRPDNSWWLGVFKDPRNNVYLKFSKRQEEVVVRKKDDEIIKIKKFPNLLRAISKSKKIIKRKKLKAPNFLD